MDPATRGQTIKRARRRHGYSQSVLAGLVGRSESWLSQVERGILSVDSHEILTRLARVLRLDLTELTGTETEAATDMRYDAARAIERAMMRYSTLETIVAETGIEPRVDSAELLVQAHQTYAAPTRSTWVERVSSDENLARRANHVC